LLLRATLAKRLKGKEAPQKSVLTQSPPDLSKRKTEKREEGKGSKRIRAPVA